MNIIGIITGIQYKIYFADELQKVDIKEFNINEVSSSCIVDDNKNTFAISKWVSPKRTRSYPYERVYNTLNISKKITIIPLVKDEGFSGDRDFLQWDTVSLMSLLDVFVVFAYYNKADKIGEKITNQKFDNEYVLSKIREIQQYHSSALHWNLNELNTKLVSIVDMVIHSYSQIGKDLKVRLHNSEGIEKYKEKIGKDISLFMNFSREKAEQAQAREIATIQPKENISKYIKGKITITNYLGGKYFLTIDEVNIKNENLYLMECKHSKNSILPSKGDIKDGLLKMILYTNLSKVQVNNQFYNYYPILKLTSSKLSGKVDSKSSIEIINKFFNKNNFSETQKNLIKILFREANENNFQIIVSQEK